MLKEKLDNFARALWLDFASPQDLFTIYVDIHYHETLLLEITLQTAFFGDAHNNNRLLWRDIPVELRNPTLNNQMVWVNFNNTILAQVAAAIQTRQQIELNRLNAEVNAYQLRYDANV